MRKSLTLLIFSLAVLILWSVSVFAASPQETIQTQVNRALEVLRDPALKGESAKETKERRFGRSSMVSLITPSFPKGH